MVQIMDCISQPTAKYSFGTRGRKGLLVAAANIFSFIRMTRPVFLLGGILLYMLGAFAAISAGYQFDLARYISGQVLVTAIQLMTQYSNEYYDISCDRLNQSRTWFSGGSGVLSAGTLPVQTARSAMFIFAGVGVSMIIYTGLQVPALFVIGAVSLAAAWSYSGPPLTLVSTGFGELAASLVVALMVPIVGFLMQSRGALDPAFLLVCLPMVLIHFAMLIAFQIPDRHADEAAGKRTLAVRHGVPAAVLLHNLALAAAFGLLFILVAAGFREAVFTWLALPFAVWQVLRLSAYAKESPAVSPGKRYFWLTMRAVGLLALTNFLWLLGYIINFLERGYFL
jgi:1,4-dihydroxy-2-naphthoate polyprenyltransferase